MFPVLPEDGGEQPGHMIEHLRMPLKRRAGEDKTAQKQNARNMIEPHRRLKHGERAQGAGTGRRRDPVGVGRLIDRAGDDALLGSARLTCPAT